MVKTLIETLIVCAVVFGPVFYACVTAIIAEKRKKKKEAALEEQIDQMGITKSADHTFSLLDVYYRFIADDESRTIYITGGLETADFVPVPYEKITGFNTSSDIRVTGSGTRDTGKTWRGTVNGDYSVMWETETYAKRSVFSYKAILKTADPDKPEFVFDLIRWKTKLTDPSYENAVSFAKNVRSVVDNIIKENKKAGTKSPSLPVPAPDPPEDISDRMKQLKQLHEDALITDEEYAAKKAELLKRL